MEIICELVKQRWNPQTNHSWEAIRTIVQFPLMNNFVDFVSLVKENCFIIKVDDLEYQAVAYQQTENSQSIRINLWDSSCNTLVVFLLDIYAPLSAIASICSAKKLIITL